MPLIFDLETDGLLPEVSKIHCIVVKDMEDGVVSYYHNDYEIRSTVGGKYLGDIKCGVARLKLADKLIGHNGLGYDIEVLKKLYPDAIFDKLDVTDTLLMSRLMYPDMLGTDLKINKKYQHQPDKQVPRQVMGRHSLEAWGWRLGEHKGEFGKTADWATFTQEMLDYCIQDIKVTEILYKKFLSLDYSQIAIDLEHKVAKIINQQCKNGWEFDKAAANTLLAELIDKRSKLTDQLREVFHGWEETMKKPQHYTYGTFQAVNKSDLEDKVYEFYKGIGKKRTREAIKAEIIAGPPQVKKFKFNPKSKRHQARALSEKYGWKPTVFNKDGSVKIDEAILETLDYPEARILHEFEIVQDRIEKLKEGRAGGWIDCCRDDGRVYGGVITNGCVTGRASHNRPNLGQVPAVDKPYGKECRSFFKVKAGHVLLGTDMSGLELRCLGSYMSRYDNGAYAKAVVEGNKEEGTDVHTLTMKAAGLPTRDNAKTFIYGFLYGAGPEKVGKIVKADAVVGKKLINNFLKKFPALDKLKNDVENAAKRGYIKALDGRRIPIRARYAALNSLLQSAGAILCKNWMVKLQEELEYEFRLGTVKQVGWVHDEIQLEILDNPEIIERAKKACVRAAERSSEDFKFYCPLTAEVKVGKSWDQTH